MSEKKWKQWHRLVRAYANSNFTDLNLRAKLEEIDKLRVVKQRHVIRTLFDFDMSKRLHLQREYQEYMATTGKVSDEQILEYLGSKKLLLPQEEVSNGQSSEQKV